MIKKFIKQLTFRQVILILVGFVIVLYIISTLLPASIRQTIDEITGGGDQVNVFVADPQFQDYEGRAGQETELVETEANKSLSILDVMPYIGERFTVEYVDGSQEFRVTLDPTYGATEEDAYDWMSTFGDVPDVKLLNIVFIDPWAEGPPTG